MATESKTNAAMLPENWPQNVLQLIARSIPIQLIILGIVCLLAGYLKQTGSFAAMLAVWGGALVLVGGTGFLLSWKTRH